jgi:hypothetical protein
MNDKPKAFEEFLNKEEPPKQPREQVRHLVNSFCKRTDTSPSLCWGLLYLHLEADTGYRVPNDAKTILRAIEAAGHIETLLRLAKTLE